MLHFRSVSTFDPSMWSAFFPLSRVPSGDDSKTRIRESNTPVGRWALSQSRTMSAELFCAGTYATPRPWVAKLHRMPSLSPSAYSLGTSESSSRATIAPD